MNQQNNDPRVVGGRYHSHAFDYDYDVLSIEFDAHGWLQHVTIYDHSNGRTRTHGTAWDKRDRVVAQ